MIKHLPDWETRQDSTTFAHDVPTLKIALGQRAVLDLIDFAGGTEAVSAPYPAGKLLIVEYSSPQASIAADEQIKAALEQADDAGTIYRRIGNYNAFVFDAPDAAAANALLDQVKYEKNVVWLGKDPHILQRAEHAFAITTSDIFLSTVIVIGMGIGFALVGGLITGLVYFSFQTRRRAGMVAFSDAGGMVRLNLDGLTPDLSPDRLLGE